MITTGAELDLFRSRIAASMSDRMPRHIERLGWNAEQLAGLQRARLRALLARAIERSPFHSGRLAGIDISRFELGDLAQLPIMTKAQMMDSFDNVASVTRPAMAAFLAGAAAWPTAW